MESAIFGLVGVIVGGMLTAGSNYFFERRREGAQLKKASRLIDADLLWGETAARICVEKQHWWTQDLQLTTEGWPKYKDVLALGLPYAAWVKVATAVLAVDHLMVARGTLTGDIAASTVATIVPILQDVKAGRCALAPLVKA